MRSNQVTTTKYDLNMDKIVYFKPGMPYREYKSTVNPEIGGVGSSHNVEINVGPDDNGIVSDLVLTFLLDGSDTNILTLREPFELFTEFKLEVNGREIIYYKNAEEIAEAVTLYRHKYTDYELDFFREKQRRLTSKTKDHTAETFATAKLVTLPLSVLFPWFFPHTTGNGFQKIKVYFRFHPNYSSAPMLNKYVASSTTTNAWDASVITIRDLSLWRQFTKYEGPVPLTNLTPVHHITKFEHILTFRNRSWNVVNTDRIRVDLGKDFLKRSGCNALTIKIFNNAGNTAYNSADAMKFFGSSKYIGYDVRFNNQLLLGYSNTAMKNMQVMHQRDQYKRRYGNEMDFDLEATTDNEKMLYYHHGLMIDLTAHQANVDADTSAISGIYNGDNGYVIDFVCHNAISTDCDIFVCLHYNAIMETSNGQIKITE